MEINKRKVRERALIAFLDSGKRYGELPGFSDNPNDFEVRAYLNAAKRFEFAYPEITKRLTFYRYRNVGGTYSIYVKRLGLNGGSLIE